MPAQQSFFENIWSWLNKDDSIGHKVWIFKHDDLADGGTIDFSHQWNAEGSWKIYGHISASEVCPAKAIESLFSGITSARSMSESGEYSSRMIVDPDALTRDREDPRKERELAKARTAATKTFDLDSLRKFRDGTYRNYPGLANWWNLAQRNIPSIIRILLTQPKRRAPAYELMNYLAVFANNPEAKIPSNVLKETEQLLLGTKLSTSSRRLSIDCSRALSVLPMLLQSPAPPAHTARTSHTIPSKEQGHQRASSRLSCRNIADKNPFEPNPLPTNQRDGHDKVCQSVLFNRYPLRLIFTRGVM